FSPSLLSSPLASLCLELYDTRSRSVKPSCAVTKLTLALGCRASAWYRSELPVSRDANTPSVAGSPRQKSRTVSRYRPFHSDHSGGEVATLLPPPPASHRSAMRFTLGTAGCFFIKWEEARSRAPSLESVARPA